MHCKKDFIFLASLSFSCGNFWTVLNHLRLIVMWRMVSIQKIHLTWHHSQQTCQSRPISDSKARDHPIPELENPVRKNRTPNLRDEGEPAVKPIKLQSAAFVAANEVMAASIHSDRSASTSSRLVSGFQSERSTSSQAWRPCDERGRAPPTPDEDEPAVNSIGTNVR